jgi:uronate dehydrogenase
MAMRDDYRLVLFNRWAITTLGPSETLIRGDTVDAPALEAAARGADAIVDMAGGSDVESFRGKLLPVNVLGTHNTYEAARVSGVPRLIHASTQYVVGHYPTGQSLSETVSVRPDSMYAVIKCDLPFMP